jgi:hypothetical protein
VAGKFIRKLHHQQQQQHQTLEIRRKGEKTHFPSFRNEFHEIFSKKLKFKNERKFTLTITPSLSENNPILPGIEMRKTFTGNKFSFFSSRSEKNMNSYGKFEVNYLARYNRCSE